MNAENARVRKEMEEFWCDLHECVIMLQKRGKVVLLGDMNAKVGSMEIERYFAVSSCCPWFSSTSHPL